LFSGRRTAPRRARAAGISSEGLIMSGHSKWANIQHRKGRQDAKRSNLWTKLVREIIVAARMGGGDPDSNSRLRLALFKARAGNVPKDTIKNAILKGTGQLEGVSYEEVRYEGYGIGGAALIIDCTTDNRVRTVADVRHLLSHHGGNLGAEGSVSFMFKHEGEFFFAPGKTNEDAVMEAALEAGADDVISNDDGSIEVTCEPEAFDAVQKALEKAGLEPDEAEITWKPLNEVKLEGSDAEKMQNLIDDLEDLDDVQNVYTTAVFDTPDDEE
jgi:YebC/PmpR family DNA-binding regulatory protein